MDQDKEPCMKKLRFAAEKGNACLQGFTPSHCHIMDLSSFLISMILSMASDSTLDMCRWQAVNKGFKEAVEDCIGKRRKVYYHGKPVSSEGRFLEILGASSYHVPLRSGFRTNARMLIATMKSLRCWEGSRRLWPESHRVRRYNAIQTLYGELREASEGGYDIPEDHDGFLLAMLANGMLTRHQFFRLDFLVSLVLSGTRRLWEVLGQDQVEFLRFWLCASVARVVDAGTCLSIFINFAMIRQESMKMLRPTGLLLEMLLGKDVDLGSLASDRGLHDAEVYQTVLATMWPAEYGRRRDVTIQDLENIKEYLREIRAKAQLHSLFSIGMFAYTSFC